MNSSYKSSSNPPSFFQALISLRIVRLHTPHLTAIFSVVICSIFSLISCLRCLGDISDILIPLWDLGYPVYFACVNVAALRVYGA